jgi:hypothetical protein
MIMADEKRLVSLQTRVDALKRVASDERPVKQIKKEVGASEKGVVGKEKVTKIDAGSPNGPVALDIGTSHIIAAQNKRDRIETIKELNAFFTVPNAKYAKDILNRKDVIYYERGNQYYITGYFAENFANLFNTNTRRPMKEGLLSPNEGEALSVIQAIVNTLIQKPKKFGEILCFVVPGEPLGGTGSVLYHQLMIKRFIGSLGYSPLSINEGMAIVVSELSEDDFTGIGISMGGGMCNICLSYLSFPVITYSIQMAGDYIDSMVGGSLGEPATRIKAIKEEELDLTREPKDRVMTALHIFYDEVIFRLLESLQRVLNSKDNIPKIKTPIPIVLSGATAMPNGCKGKFENMLKNVSLPVEISTVHLAKDLLNTPAKGALIVAMREAG